MIKSSLLVGLAVSVVLSSGASAQSRTTDGNNPAADQTSAGMRASAPINSRRTPTYTAGESNQIGAANRTAGEANQIGAANRTAGEANQIGAANRTAGEANQFGAANRTAADAALVAGHKTN
jgi:hypothetical protein